MLAVLPTISQAQLVFSACPSALPVLMDPPASAATGFSFSAPINSAIVTTQGDSISLLIMQPANLVALLLLTASLVPNFLTVHSATIALLENTITHPQEHASYANPRA